MHVMINWEEKEVVEIDTSRYYELYEEYLNQDGRSDSDWDLLYTEEFEEQSESILFVESIKEFQEWHNKEAFDKGMEAYDLEG